MPTLLTLPTLTALPTRAVTTSSPVKIEKEPFKRDLSIFKDFNEDNQASRKECLKRDIKYSKIKQLFKE